MTGGTLYIVATPIGNLGDISVRALDVLKNVAVIAAEDTRHVRKLLTHYDIKTPLISYHDHVERSKADRLIGELTAGKDVALVSDSGTPLISDPGYHLVQKALAQNIKLVPVPGASALLAALVVSGLAVDSFVFEGYLSRNASKRRKKLKSLVDEERTIIVYETPHRLLKALADIKNILGNRRCAIVRELTKKFEEQFRGTIDEARAHFEKTGVRGEFVLVIEGKSKK